MKYEIHYTGNYQTECVHEINKSMLETEASQEAGGRGELFSPTDLLAVSLGSSLLTTMALIAEYEKVSLEGSSAEIEKKMSSQPRRVSEIIVHFKMPKAVDGDLRKRLEASTKQDPVYSSLSESLKKSIQFTWE